MTACDKIKKEILKKIQDAKSSTFIYSEYDSLLPDGYIDEKHKPTEKLIFLRYEDFDNLIQEFFDKLSQKYDDNYDINFFKKPQKTPIPETAQMIKIEKEKFSKKFKKIYEIIRDSFGAKLQNENELYICPYCEKNYINIIQSNDKTIKPDLDHFYPKALYPFLGCSIENLIPSCQVCNARLKGSIDFYEKKHIHPLKNRFFSEIEYDHDEKGIYIKNLDSLNNTEEKKNYLKTFQIQEIYATHSEILENIKIKHKKYTEAKQKSLKENCLTLTEDRILDIIFHEYKDENKKCPFRKLKKDLYDKIVR
jgi:hypothetical protein